MYFPFFVEIGEEGFYVLYDVLLVGGGLFLLMEGVV